MSLFDFLKKKPSLKDKLSEINKNFFSQVDVAFGHVSFDKPTKKDFELTINSQGTFLTNSREVLAKAKELREIINQTKKVSQSTLVQVRVNKKLLSIIFTKDNVTENDLMQLFLLAKDLTQKLENI